MVYKKNTIGVFIEDVDGNLWAEKDWDGSKTANGVALINENINIVIGNQSPNVKSIGYFGELYEGLGTDDRNTALLDYNGKSNTEAILNSNNGQSSEAFQYADAYLFPRGNEAYIPSAGEAYSILLNYKAIMSCAAKCGILLDNGIGGLSTLTSTLCKNIGYIWFATNSYTNYIDIDYYTNSRTVIPIASRVI